MNLIRVVLIIIIWAISLPLLCLDVMSPQSIDPDTRLGVMYGIIFVATSLTLFLAYKHPWLKKFND
ncbi:hypothetical protein J4403_04260 [Candidatus Woesearchaeota archaeon]|nr:hypothetical protein [Candidatus Woesearchaeota archaeon]